VIEGLAGLEAHATLSSSSDRLRELAQDGAPPFTAVLAGAQTRGRGRGGRRWVSVEGSGLWLSVLLPSPPGGPPGAASIAVGVAAARAVESVAGVEVGLKWPNDLLVPMGPDRPVPAKVGGVLCEAVRRPDGPGVVAGIGINLRPPRGLEDLDEAARSALEVAAFLETAAGRAITEMELASATVRELRSLADPPPDRVEGELAAAWEKRDLLKGRPVVTEMAPEGVALGLDPDGALRVADASGGLHRVRAGSVRLAGEGPSALFSSGSDECIS
jgi:BirA family transcriptional regulator, biotin operon repressor / biotin---[acetyl-CoA-carboxylase] ligase